MALQNNSKGAFINFPVLGQKEISKSKKKKIPSFLHLFYSKLCYPGGQGLSQPQRNDG